MASVIIPPVVNWSVTPQNGTEDYFNKMNTWLTESTVVISSFNQSIVKINEATIDINEKAAATTTARDIAVAAKDEAITAVATLQEGSINDTIIATDKAFSNQHIEDNYYDKTEIDTAIANATLDINALSDKSDLINTDNFVIQEAEGDFKKVSYENLFDEISTKKVLTTGTAILNGTVNNAITMNGIVLSLDLEVGDVIRIDCDEPIPENKVTAQEIDGGIIPIFRSLSVVDGDVYCATENSPVATRGIWKQAGGEGSFKRVYDAAMRYATPVVSDGIHYYFSFDGNKIKKVVDKDWDNVIDLTLDNRRYFGLTFNPHDGLLYAVVNAGLIYKIHPDTGADTPMSSGNKNWTSITVNPETGVMYANVWSGGIYSSESNFDVELFPNLTGGNQAQIQWVNNTMGKGLLFTRKNNEPAFVSMVDNPTYAISGIPTQYFTFANVDSVGGIVAYNDQIYVADNTGVYKQELVSYNKLHTVESITNDNSIIVNYEHSGNRGNGSLKLPDATEDVTVTRIAKWYNAPISLGQAWVNVLSLRAINTEYTNTAGRAIAVAVSGFTNAGFRSTFSIDASIVQNSIAYSGSSILTPLVSGVQVPSQSKYSTTLSDIEYWQELR